MVATTSTYPFDIMRTQFSLQVNNMIKFTYSMYYIISSFFPPSSSLLQGNIKLHNTMKSFVTSTISNHGVQGSIHLICVLPVYIYSFIIFQNVIKIHNLRRAICRPTSRISRNYAVHGIKFCLV